MALARTTKGWQDDSLAPQIDLPFAGERQERLAAEKAELERDRIRADEQIGSNRNASAEAIDRMQAETERGRSNYNQGGAVYKHAHPTYTKFGQTADSSLLAKGRK